MLPFEMQLSRSRVNDGGGVGNVDVCDLTWLDRRLGATWYRFAWYMSGLVPIWLWVVMPYMGINVYGLDCIPIIAPRLNEA